MEPSINNSWINTGRLPQGVTVPGKPNPQGEASHHVKLTEAQVLEIRALYASGEYTMRTLAAIYAITAANVRHIVSRKTWKHI